MNQVSLGGCCWRKINRPNWGFLDSREQSSVFWLGLLLVDLMIVSGGATSGLVMVSSRTTLCLVTMSYGTASIIFFRILTHWIECALIDSIISAPCGIHCAGPWLFSFYLFSKHHTRHTLWPKHARAGNTSLHKHELWCIESRRSAHSQGKHVVKSRPEALRRIMTDERGFEHKIFLDRLRCETLESFWVKTKQGDSAVKRSAVEREPD